MSMDWMWMLNIFAMFTLIIATKIEKMNAQKQVHKISFGQQFGIKSELGVNEFEGFFKIFNSGDMITN